MDINSQLKEMERTIAEKEHIEAKLNALKTRERDIGGKVVELQQIMEYECADVEKLEKLGAVSLFYSLIGKKVEKLDAEKREAVVATEKYKLAVAELDDILRDIEKCERELRNIKRCEEKYDELWKLAVDQSIMNGREQSDTAELSELKEQAAKLAARLKNTEEAIAEGDKLFSLVDEIAELIAIYIYVMRNYNRHTPESVMIEAHEKLMLADNKLTHLPGQISRFQAELADVDLSLDPQQQDVYNYALVGSSNYYIDMFISTGNSVYDVQRALGELKPQVSRVLYRLSQRRERLQKNILDTQENINKIISL